VSGKLVNEVLENAPDDLSMPELLILVALAEDARDRDRTARYETSLKDLHRRTRRPTGTIKNALGSLVRRGLITRVFERGQIGTVQHYRLTELYPHHRQATATTTPKEETA